MVNWKSPDSTERLVAAIIAAHPNLSLNYYGIAAMFGQDTTYNSIEGRLRGCRKLADELRTSAAARGVTVQTPTRARNSNATRTPQGSRVTKSGKSYSGKSTTRKELKAMLAMSPTRAGSSNGMSIMDAICVDDGSDVEEVKRMFGKEEEDETPITIAKRAAIAAFKLEHVAESPSAGVKGEAEVTENVFMCAPVAPQPVDIAVESGSVETVGNYGQLQYGEDPFSDAV